ncbi:MAG: NAD(P)/FAD-dependent oxidoreductase [Clostridia bacterium]|nr:NAD(P)/FAD-dependent oxidoreductase [Clostridia bacterium]
MFDIAIIGAGVIGCSIARALSKYNLKICLIEKESDVSLGASKANSGIVHGGYAGKAGTLKGELCIKGNAMYDQLEKELNFGFRRCGGMILGFDEEDRSTLLDLMKNGEAVGQEDFIWLDQEALRKKEPHISENAKFALFMPSIGVASPYELTIALVENAIENGVTLFLEHEVLTIEKDQHFIVKTNQGNIESRRVINASGLNSGKLNDFFDGSLKIYPRRGQYILFGKDQSELVNHVIFQPPTALGKGVLVTTTYHGNFMIGPDAEDLMEDIKTDTSLERLKVIIEDARKSIPNFDIRRAITTFSGIRAISETKDFFIKEVIENFITVGGIDSPGLTSAPAIAEYVVKMIQMKENLVEKPFNPNRKSYFDYREGNPVCLCEEVSEEAIRAALKGPITINSTDAIKRRTRAGMGLCQGRRCEANVSRIISSYNSEVNVSKRTESNVVNRVPIMTIRNLYEKKA